MVVKKLHIAMFPWLAFGHMIPYFELAKRIAQKGHEISFLSTPRNIQRLPKIPANLSSLMNFVSFTLPLVDNLPQDAEATSDLPVEEVPYLKIAFDKLQDSVAQFLETSTPDWLICDFASYWLPPIAAKLGVSRAHFSVFWAGTYCFSGSSSVLLNGDPRTKPEDFTVSPNWVPFHSNIAFRLHEAKALFHFREVNEAGGVNDGFRLRSTIAGVDVIAVKSCLELESEWLNLLGELHNKPVAPVGLLPPSANNTRDGPEDKSWLTISEWLGKQKLRSVVYIAFGSELNLSQGQLTELALGLEQSGLPFLWALRKLPNSVELPEGFEERVKGRGVVWTSWAPQLRVLAHEALGAFLTHCGYSSVIESLYFGLPLAMLPFVTDQGLIARVFAEKKVGIEIKRDEEDGSFTRDSVAESLRLVVVEEEGRIYREKAKEMRVLFADEELHDHYIDKFVELLQNHRQVSN